MKIHFHPHALTRIDERGATKEEVIQTVTDGERFAAKFGRHGFRRNVAYNDQWRSRFYANKQIEAFAAQTPDGWIVITVS